MLFSVVNLGCKVNRVESDACAVLLESLGWELGAIEAADLIVVNTCTVTAEADKKTRKAVRHALSANPVAHVLVTGCAAAMTPAVFTNMSDRVGVAPKIGLETALREVAHALSSGDGVLGEWVRPGLSGHASPAAGAGAHPDEPSEADGGGLPRLLPVGESFRTRVGVKIQDGCNNACTYCIVHVARGRSTSVPASRVIEQCRALHGAGVREIVLTGINLGCYRDPEGNYPTLASLLEKLLDETGGRCPSREDALGLPKDGCPSHEGGLASSDEGCLSGDGAAGAFTRFRIGSIEPRDVSSELIDVMAGANGRVARHLHLPLQSGSTKVLREMARPYTAEAFEQLVAHMRVAMPELALSTDVIVGFPGETEDDFAETVAVCERSRFMKLHVFPYSIRKGTPAAERKDQVPPEVKQARAEVLRSLSERLAAEDFAARAGRTELVLVEQEGRGTTESYHEVLVDPGLSVGALIPTELTRARRAE